MKVGIQGGRNSLALRKQEGMAVCQSYYRGTYFFPFKDQDLTTRNSCALADASSTSHVRLLLSRNRAGGSAKRLLLRKAAIIISR